MGPLDHCQSRRWAMSSMEGYVNERRMGPRRSWDERRSIPDRRAVAVSPLFYYETRFSAERRLADRRMRVRRQPVV